MAFFDKMKNLAILVKYSNFAQKWQFWLRMIISVKIDNFDIVKMKIFVKNDNFGQNHNIGQNNNFDKKW